MDSHAETEPPEVPEFISITNETLKFTQQNIYYLYYLGSKSITFIAIEDFVAMSERTDNDMKARVILQQCLHARLQVKPPDAESEAEWAEVAEK